MPPRRKAGTKASAKGARAIERVLPGVRFSAAAVHGGTVYLAGQVADDAKGDITAQTRSVLARVDAVLKAAGSRKSKLLACTVYLADMRHFDAYNKVWDRWVDKRNMPTRATVEARLATADYLIEVVAVAAR
ncbi:MAG: RidA family protein [Alphaproteobacteria bacterium]